MRLDRNITNPRRGKYALIKLRESKLTPEQCEQSKSLYPQDTSKCFVPVETNAIDFGDSADTDFFVIRLKDKYAADALEAYALAAYRDGHEDYANDVMRLSVESRLRKAKTTPD